MNHCILIRSAYSPSVPLNVNRRRLELTRALCAASLAAQSVKTVRLVPKLHLDDPFLQERLNVYAGTGLRVVPFLSRDERPGLLRKQGWDAIIANVFKTGAVVLQTRMDDDDAIARDFCERLYVGIARQENKGWHTFPRGVYVERRAWAPYILPANQFITRRTVAGSGRHVYEIQHRQIKARELAVIDEQPAWIWCRHNDALSGSRPVEARHDLSVLTSRFSFDSSVLRPPPFRVRLLNQLIQSRGFTSYLEIGVGSGRTFHAVHASRKVGVDPLGHVGVKATSDRWFARNRQRFDLVFIDGLHHKDQVLRDVQNALHVLTPRGIVVLHDCLPSGRRQQQCPRPPGLSAWNGDVWKAVVELRRRPDLDTAVLDEDHGLGVLFPRPNSSPLAVGNEPSFDDYRHHRRKLLRVVNYPALLRFLDVDGCKPRP